MRAFPLIFFLATSFAFAEPAADRRSLTTAETAALSEPIALGHRVMAAISHYLEVRLPPSPIPEGLGLLTGTPTLELLRSTECLSDLDYALVRRHHAGLYPVPPDAPADQPILAMRTELGDLIFDTTGNVTLPVHK